LPSKAFPGHDVFVDDVGAVPGVALPGAELLGDDLLGDDPLGDDLLEDAQFDG
jgi:hypothetical protein